MTWHIVSLVGPDDHFAPATAPEDTTLYVPFGVPGHPDAVQDSITETLSAYDVTPTDAAFELLTIAISAYTADVRVPRAQAYDNWTRDMVLHISVSDVARWTACRSLLQRLLAFLTGDHWRVEVRPRVGIYRPHARRAGGPRRVQRLETSTVSLFSGGLDSFIGAVDTLEDIGQVALVGHHSRGAGSTSISQQAALAVLRRSYAPDLTPFLQFWVSPPKGTTRASEITTRARSILFLSLGILVASGLEGGRLLVPENGFISLNVPLTSARLGTFSTRTTHPFLMKLLRDLLAQLGIGVDIDVPYRFRTKGEMVASCTNGAALEQALHATMSCAHPGVGRFRGLPPNIHCGYCMPCLIRRSAILHDRLLDPTLYVQTNLRQPLGPRRGSDLRAVKMALDHYTAHPPRLSDALRAGPLPGTDAELSAYLTVFQRGLHEVEGFMHRYE
jgi:hypothetical protein